MIEHSSATDYTRVSVHAAQSLSKQGLDAKERDGRRCQGGARRGQERESCHCCEHGEDAAAEMVGRVYQSRCEYAGRHGIGIEAVSTKPLFAMLHMLLYGRQLKWMPGLTPHQIPDEYFTGGYYQANGPQVTSRGYSRQGTQEERDECRTKHQGIHRLGPREYLQVLEPSLVLFTRQAADWTQLSLASLVVGKDPAGRKGFEEAETSSGRGESSSAERPVFE
jgi:hypothetical protein